MDHWPNWARARHYRDLATQALTDAERSAHQNMRSGFLHMAAGWLALAQEAERLALEPDEDDEFPKIERMNWQHAPPALR